MAGKPKYIQVTTTTAKKSDAQKIADLLLDKKLVGCVQVVGPVESRYIWEGKRERTREYLCIAKTRIDLYKDVEATIKSIHPYELPEIIAIPVIAGSREYLKWLGQIIE